MMMIHRQPDLTETIIPNSLPALGRIREKILDEVERCGFGEEDMFGIALALAEALGNAYEHGNRLDPGKRITVRYRVSCTAATIEIQDEGDGFDPGLVPDPTDDARLCRESGRGIQLMKAFLDDVQYSPRGNLVRLTKRAQTVRSGGSDRAMAS